MKVGILADDLTSATDGAAPFVSMGHRCFVFNDYQRSSLQDAAIISVNKASRAVSIEDAVDRATLAAKSLASAEILYSTVDSTIRGHVGAEVSAARAASGRAVAIVAPAFPAGGRTTEGGRQLLRGVPLEKTEFARDPLHPITDSHLRALFRDIQDAEVRLLGLAEVRALKSGELVANDCKLLIADAATQDDLALLVNSAADPRSILWCGSPGLATALADYVGPSADHIAMSTTTAALNLFVIGSVNPLSREQCSRLMSTGNVRQIVVDAEQASHSPILAAESAVAQYGQSGSTGDVILTTSERGTSAAPRSIAIALGQAVRMLMERNPVTGLFVTGGDTAESVLSVLEIRSLELLGEIEPGTPVGRTTGSHPMHIITKAGGFGSSNVLLKSAELLRGLWLGDKK
ncbi:four-carbon acid sugar kinase family protein [Rhizobium laguerreae]|uniref:four-carbon acid sugar kinase family protein n=1 Tax=Rhizobium laguerreae TaxID=1076926 RepID=UPI001C92680C|nr:four-carbon acid sugar kinase family protein [Rhizobium laguerreae]MBY3348542.1 four-carbon acid sugar kinase family protein [Rhizobium laguerreae]MBY3355503.1 four-carbon acid sugar kinase family protein [Rhizobium laguerreae]MBY3376696.1 four-carbon acid sugar kinase family protein [Rhizobium laguerreae]MBY3390518.1 four-carbon acid sugar kinase family protein [Rhizobium laguerreae]MBY3404178.1 four-carbon acid sugar kinase family protein [Rhizobium laguerreae]